MIPLSVPNISGNEWKYVKECLDTGWVSSVGAYVTRFENLFASYLGIKYAVATMNGTAALHIALLLCDVQPDDEVIVPDLTFVAPVNAVRYCHAHPVFMDASPVNFGIDPGKLHDFLDKHTTCKGGYTINRQTGRKIKAIIPVHVLGLPADMTSILEICARYNIQVIEDATESLGSYYKGKLTGNFSRIACFSFNGNKIITTGGGGMLVTNDENLARRAKHLTTTAKTDAVAFIHDEVGYNYRLVNVLAAMGVAQMEQLPRFLEIKKQNLARYAGLLDTEGVHLHPAPPDTDPNWWMYPLIIDIPGLQAMELVDYLAQRDIQSRPMWELMHRLPMYRHYQAFPCDEAERIHRTVVNIPCSTNLTAEDIETVAREINAFARKYRY